MNRGYIKFWRIAEDSRVWSRGIEYRGLLITLLTMANHKGAYFLGVKIERGQVGISMQNLAADLGISRQKLIRMFSNLEKDEVVTVKNSDNRFTLITIKNYNLYQGEKDGTRTTVDTTDDTTTGQRPDTIKEYKNNINTGGRENARAHVASSVPENPDSEKRDFTPMPPENGLPKKTDSPSKGTPEWPAFLSCWEVYPVKQGQEEAWCEWMRLKENGTLAQAWEIRDAILTMIGEDSRWLRGKVPRMAKWLSGKGWNDQPYKEPMETLPATRDGPRATTVAQQQVADRDTMAKMLLAHRREKRGNEDDTQQGDHVGGNISSAVSALPAGGIHPGPTRGPGR